MLVLIKLMINIFIYLYKFFFFKQEDNFICPPEPTAPIKRKANDEIALVTHTLLPMSDDEIALITHTLLPMSETDFKMFTNIENILISKYPKSTRFATKQRLIRIYNKRGDVDIWKQNHFDKIKINPDYKAQEKKVNRKKNAYTKF